MVLKGVRINFVAYSFGGECVRNPLYLTLEFKLYGLACLNNEEKTVIFSLKKQNI